MYVSLQYGLYELCRVRVAKDSAFVEELGGIVPDKMTDELFDKYRLFQLNRSLALVYDKSRFYRQKFDQAGLHRIQLDDMSQLSEIPFTLPKDLSGNSYDFLCTSQANVEKPVTFFSSGSTGLQKRIYFSMADIQRIMDFLPRGMHTVIGPEEGRVQVFLQNSYGRGIGQILANSLIVYGIKAWVSDLADSTDEILKTCIDNKVNVWFGDAATIYRATKILSEEVDLSSLGMECIFITMTNIPKSMSEYLAKTWNCRVSTHYGLTESGWGLAVDCDCCLGYHYDELDMHIEIVEADGDKVLPMGETGEVVLTTLSRDCMPLIRYRTGDIAKMEDSICGSHLKVLGHIQRRKEGAYTLSNGRDIWPALLEDVIFSQPELLDYRIFARGDQLYLDIESLGDGSAVSEELSLRLAAMKELEGMPKPVVKVLPTGALREYCYEKKRIMPMD